MFVACDCSAIEILYRYSTVNSVDPDNTELMEDRYYQKSALYVDSYISVQMISTIIGSSVKGFPESISLL